MSMESRSRNMVRFQEGPGAVNQKAFIVFPWNDVSTFLQNVVHEMADWGGPKCQVLHAVGKSTAQNCFSGPIPYYLPTEKLDSSWVGWPAPGPPTRWRRRAGRGVDSQHNWQLNPCVNKGHRAGRKLETHLPWDIDKWTTQEAEGLTEG